MSASSQRVADAVVLGVRASLDNAGRVNDRTAFARSVRGRLQSTYGAELRRIADADPALEPVDLFRAVIVPKEFPWAGVGNPLVESCGRRLQGDRGDDLLEPWEHENAENAPGWRAGLAEARRRVRASTEAERAEKTAYVDDRRTETEREAQPDWARSA